MPSDTVRRGAWLLLAALLWGYAITTAALRFSTQVPVDLYHPWGVPLVKTAAPGTNPWRDTATYGDALARLAAASPDPKLRQASAHWQPSPNRAEPTGTPFFYAVMSFLPADFATAHAMLATLEFLAVLAGFTLLARLRGLALGPALCAAAIGAAGLNSFVQDVRYGNVNSLQVGALAALLHVAARPAAQRGRVLDLAYLPALALLVVFKPNTLLMAGALALHELATRDARGFAARAALALVAALAAIAIGAWYFDGFAAWRDWLAYLGGAGGGTLLYTLEQGNHSLAMLLAQRGGAYGATGYGVFLGVALAFGVLVAATRAGRDSRAAVPVARALAADPWFMLSLGVLATFATTPLLWPHYQLFAAIPIAWLLLRERRWDLATACAVLAFVAQSRVLIDAALPVDARGLLRIATLFSWMPLVVGLFAFVAQRRREVMTA